MAVVYLSYSVYNIVDNGDILITELRIRACLVSRSMQIARQILCISRQFFAEILYVFQEKLTKKYAKYASKMRAERY